MKCKETLSRTDFIKIKKTRKILLHKISQKSSKIYEFVQRKLLYSISKSAKFGETEKSAINQPTKKKKAEIKRN